MTKRVKKSRPGKAILLPFIGLAALSVIITFLLRGKDAILLNPKGVIASEQLRLMITATLIMLTIAIPALFFLYYFAWKYRENNEKVNYEGSAAQSKSLALLIWGAPTVIMLVLVVLLVPATHKLEPRKDLSSTNKPLTIQVVAMRWKWLFIYPEQKIATVNYVQIPVNTPVQFELTADETPMSSFWIPHLGGQLYAMTEHVNRLNLMADELGDFEGSVAEINGAGFSGMRFNTHVSTKQDFDTWLLKTKMSFGKLDSSEYEHLLEPSENHPVAFYAEASDDIYSNILNKYAGGAHHHGADPEEYEAGH